MPPSISAYQPYIQNFRITFSPMKKATSFISIKISSAACQKAISKPPPRQPLPMAKMENMPLPIRVHLCRLSCPILMSEICAKKSGKPIIHAAIMEMSMITMPSSPKSYSCVMNAWAYWVMIIMRSGVSLTVWQVTLNAPLNLWKPSGPQLLRVFLKKSQICKPLPIRKARTSQSRHGITATTPRKSAKINMTSIVMR